MADQESLRPDKIDFVVICTPNNTHYAIAKKFLEKGFNVFCEKPMTWEITEAEELERMAREKDLLFGVAYAYSGYHMVKFAKMLVDEGKLGKIINVNGEYPQEWLIDELSETISKTAKFSGWRADPKVSGISNCTGDIGTHIEHTVSYITGLRVKRLCARTDYFQNDLDLNSNVLLELSNGASGVFWSSQVAIGHMNGLRVRIYGTLGSLEWIQEQPEQLKFTPVASASALLSWRRLCRRPCHELSRMSRWPLKAITSLCQYVQNVHDRLVEKANDVDRERSGFPNATDGVEVKFLHAVINSGKNDSKWVTV